MTKYYLGIDLGGTKILTALADDRGAILGKRKIMTEANQGIANVLANIVHASQVVLDTSSLSFADIQRVGVGIPGWVDVEAGLVHHAPNLKWEQVPITRLLEAETGTPVVIENDANAAALGEWLWGAGKGACSLIYITVSTGIGGGIIIDGRLHRGKDCRAGEIGHMIIDPKGSRCSCGNNGCLEALSSGTAIANRGKEVVEERRPSILIDFCQGDSSKVTAALVSRAAQEGDHVAQEILTTAGYYLGIGLANLVNLLSPEKIILGGGVMKAGDLILESTKCTLQDITKASSLGSSVEICKAALGDESGVVGALMVARNRLPDDNFHIP